MRYEFTLRSPDGDRDVAVLTSVRATVADVHARLAEALSLPRAGALIAAGQPLIATAEISTSGLRTGAIVEVGERRAPATPAGLPLHIVGGIGAGRTFSVGRGTARIGRDIGCTIPLPEDDRVSRVHATLEVSAGTLLLRDAASTNGTYVDGVPLGPSARVLVNGNVVRVGDTLLAVPGPNEPAAALRPGGARLLVIRAPRQEFGGDDRVLDLPDPPEQRRPRPVQWVAALVPALVAGALAWVTRSPVFLLFAALSPLMLVSTACGDRLHWRRARRRALGEFRSRRAEADAEVAHRLQLETATRRRQVPDAGALEAIGCRPTTRLWERRRCSPDHLIVRVGTGEPASTLRVRQGPVTRPAAQLAPVPVTVDLREGPLGVVGPAPLVAGLARWIVAQLATLHSPADVALALFLTSDSAAGWLWARWLPHLEHRVAVGPDEWRVLAGELGTAGTTGSAATPSPPRRWTVLVLDRAGGTADIAAVGALLTTDRPAGLTALCVDLDGSLLPRSCSTVVTTLGETGSRIALQRRGQPRTEAVVDRVDASWADRLARALAPLVDAGVHDDSALPTSCRLAEILPDPAGGASAEGGDPTVARVQQWWAASDGHPSTVLGLTVDGPLRVDLVADGPHALVAGTTGSGKSELLRTLVLGLALLHPPDEVAFLLIDYKGGAAFAECAALPHVAGLVTDLDPHLTGRALHSLGAELRRRERLFAGVHAADLEAYRRTGPEAVPRLVIVVDEFATLADELPDFVRGLVAVAQRGRSLGLHLVLATQRPGTAVTPDIRANTNLRLALRVTDTSESHDIIECGDAATIRHATPGRAYLRAGTNLTAFQTATAGAPRALASTTTVEVLGPWRRPAERESHPGSGEPARLVSVVSEAARSAGQARTPSPWLDPLPAQLPVAALDDARTGRIAFGLVDLPAEQAQRPILLDLEAPTSWLIVGGPRSGRSTTLATIALGAAARRSPADLEIYLLDAGGGLAGVLGPLPHVATSLGGADNGSVRTLLQRLVRRAEGNRDQQPAALLVIDDWDRTLDHDQGGPLGELFPRLLRTAPAGALTIVVAGGRTLLSPRVAGLFGQRLLLRLDDQNDYALAGVPARAVPSVLPPGRAVRATDSAELQLAFPGRTADVGVSTDCARQVAAAWSGTPTSSTAVRIRPLPTLVRLSALPAEPHRLRLGLMGDQANALSIDPFAGARRWLVAGPARSGRSSTLMTLLAEAIRIGLPVLVAAPARSPLAHRGRELGVDVISPADPAEFLPDTPSVPTLLLVDDADALVDTAVGERLTEWIRADRLPLAVLAGGRVDDLATSYRGVAAEVRRSRCGLLLQPGPLDGELFGVRLGQVRDAPPGRGFVIGEPAWGPDGDTSPAPIQVAVA